jgi:hypothetical protein
MRRLTFLVATLAALYGGYWFVGRAAVERGAMSTIESFRADGWNIGFDGLHTIGFPSRFDTTITALDISDPFDDIRWVAPFVQVFALSYQPNKLIVIFPDTQSVRVLGQTVDVASSKFRASGSVQPDTALTLHELVAEAGATTLTSDRGWSVAADHLLAAMRPDGPAANTYDVFAEVAAVRLPAEMDTMLDPADTLPPYLEVVRLDSVLTFDRPIDRFAGPGTAPLPTEVTIRDLRLVWGAMTLSGAGKLTIDPDGLAEGEIMFSITEWRTIAELAARAGLIDPGLVPTWANMGDALAQGSEVLNLPLTFAGGQMFLGPLPLGEAPTLH